MQKRRSSRVLKEHHLAEASGSRTHRDTNVPHAGFEDQAQHRPRLASNLILACRRARYTNFLGARLHRLDAERDVLVQVHSKFRGPVDDIVAAH